MFRLIFIIPGLIVLIIGSVSATNAEDQYPGRFFTTPEQRATIDSIRYGREPEIKPQPILEPETNQTNKNATKNIGPLNYKGYVKNQKGETVYWVNSSNSLESDFSNGVFELKNRQPGSVILRLFVNDEKAIDLQVGEKYIPQELSDNAELGYKSRTANTESQ